MLDMVILPTILRDLLLLENQIPFCVLKMLYKICIKSRKSLFVIATNFLWSILIIPESRNMYDSLEWLHLLNLVWMKFISRAHNIEMWRIYDYRPFTPILCVTKLRHTGIKANRHMADIFLDVKFKKSVIEMCLLLMNCVVFEQS